MFRIPDTARFLTARRTGATVAACLAMTALVAACGGGDRVKSFQPNQVIAFGDETSAFDDTATASTASARLVQFDTSAVVAYSARYTINVVPDVANFCKTSAPTDVSCTGSAALVSTDIPSSASFFVPQSSATTFRLTSGIPIVNQVETGYFNDAASPAPTIYRTTDELFYCSTDFGDDYGNWVQRLAHGLGGGSLNLGGTVGGCPQDSGGSRSYAAWGAKVDDVAAQVNTNIGVLRDGVLVTMLAGQNDIMAAYDAVIANTTTADAAQKLMRDKGAQLASVINTVVATGARVVYLTVPDMGVSPKAVVDGQTGLATALTHAFNEGYKGSGESNESGGLVLSVLNNGHKIVKVDGYNQVAALAASYPSVGACDVSATTVKMPNGVTVAAAATAGSWSATTIAKAILLNCRSNNLRVITARDLAATTPVDEARANYIYYLWADDQRLAPIGHASLAALALARIRDQL